MTETVTEKTLNDVQENARATAAGFKALANALAERTEFAPLAGRARKRAAELEANKFTIMVVGEFKRGKSTVLNAMLGSRALPMKLTPCTAIVTFVRHGPAPEVLVAFNDDRNPNPERLTLEDYNTHYQLTVDETRLGDDDPAEAARRQISDRFGPVDHAVIRYPSPFLENGVEIVDTPGLQEHDARTKRVLQNLATADAVIMVLDAVTVCNQEEIKFIEHRLRPLGLHKHVFFLINRWNLVLNYVVDPNDPAEIEKMLADQIQFINSRLVPFASAAGSDKVAKRIFKVNALGALQDRLKGVDGPALEATEMPRFERALREFLTSDRDAVRREKDLNMAENIEREVTGNVNALVHKARAPISSFEAEQAKLEEEIEQLRRIKINIESIIRAEVADTARVLGDSLETYLNEELYGRLKEHVDKFALGKLDSILTQYIALLDRFRSEENKISKQIEADLQRQLTKLFADHIDGWRERSLDLELKPRADALQKRLWYETGEYVKVLREIQGDEADTHKISEEDISRQIGGWLRGSVFGSAAAGVSMDLAPLIAGVVADIGLQVFGAGLLADVVVPGLGLIVTGVLAFFRMESNKDKAKGQLVKGLEDKKKELLLDQRFKLGESIEAGFKKIFEPIPQSIESEITVVNANMTDVLERRREADFDADGFESELRTFEVEVKKRVGDVRRLAA